jgi:RHS repeat-associated protein
LANARPLGGRQTSELVLDHELAVDPRTGVAALRVPVFATPGRHNLTPSLALAYSSSAGNSPFGQGWSLEHLPAIEIQARRHLPRWDGTDGFELGGQELVPWLAQEDGIWKPRGFTNSAFTVTFYRVRRGPTRLRVEKWVHATSGRIHFRTRDARNVITVYGARLDGWSRIADPEDDSRTLTWLPELQIDPHGNAMWLEYVPENLQGVDRAAAWEQRIPSLAQRYLKRIRYGNHAPLVLDEALSEGSLPADARWCFQLALDYGDHSTDSPTAQPHPEWPARVDPSSSYRGGFEIRTFRLCRRFLMFHEFDELGPGPTLIHSLVLDHEHDPAGATIRQIISIGHRRQAGVIESKAIPPLRLTYAPAASEAGFHAASATMQENVPAGLAMRGFSFIDLFGEGLAGILSEDDRAWYYKPNLGGGELGAQTLVLERPATTPGSFGLGDLDGDGDPELSSLAGRMAGRYGFDREEAAWSGFLPFAALPHVEALGRHAQWIDLNGDGRPDVVMCKPGSLLWFASDGEGFSAPVEIPRPDADLPAADPALDSFFADMTGDGLPDLVRVQNGRVEYWPGLGNGRFGQRVVMDGAPWFSSDASFDATRVRLVDLDGSGTNDIVYLGDGEVTCWINASGNRLVPGPRLRGLPYFDNLSNVSVLDFLGDGRSCLVWSSPLPGREASLEYLPLSPATPPRILLAVDDSRGRETRLTYSSSATHYRRDVASGRGWSTKLPNHHPVVDRYEFVDHVAKLRSVQRFEYHDGYYDGSERESRGFGCVDVYDAEAVDETPTGPGAAAFTPPSLIRTWYHLGTPMWGRHRPRDTYAGDVELPLLAPHVIEDPDALGPDTIVDGLRALAGQVIRREVYAVDEHDRRHAHPFEVQQHGYRLRRLQPGRGRDDAAFSFIEDQVATWVYEQSANDPRVQHRMVLATNDFDVPVREVSIGYARRVGRQRDLAAQSSTLISIVDTHLLDVDVPQRFELTIGLEIKHFELRGVRPNSTGLFDRGILTRSSVAAALAQPAEHHVDLPDDPSVGPRARLSVWEQTFYWNEARTSALPLGQASAPPLIHHVQRACFAPAFVAEVFGSEVDHARLIELGYVEHEGYCWRVDEVQSFTAAERFSLPEATLRGDGALRRLIYDDHSLVPKAEIDPLGNTTSYDVDYHLLGPWRTRGPNGNVHEVRYDPLGVVVVSTHHGHVDAYRWGFDEVDTVLARQPATLAAAIADPAHYLQGAATFVWYDLDAWLRDRAPVAMLTLQSEELRYDGAGGSNTQGRIQIGITYFDGLGRELQRKQLVDDGPAIQRDAQGRVIVDASGRPSLATASPRWWVSGHIVYDAKQHPGREYEPFFSPRPTIEDDEVLRHVGVSVLVQYDARGRVSRQSFPNGTFTTTTYRAWSIEHTDPEDNVINSIYGLMRARLLDDTPERQAYESSKAHDGTTRSTFLDPLGREVGTLARGGTTAPDIRKESRLDLEGRPAVLIDPNGLIACRYRHDMRGLTVHQHSIDAGEARSLPDAYDRFVTRWDGRGFRFDREFDRADRPLHTHVRGGDGPALLDHHVEQCVYGESLTDRQAAIRRNLLGRLVLVRDGAGEVEVGRYDGAGEALATTRRMRDEVDTEPDWRTPPTLDETFTRTVHLDALGRLRSDRLHDGTIRTYQYLRSGPLERVRITSPDGNLVDTPILDGSKYDAHGQQTDRALGNGVRVHYDYDPQTHRLSAQTATLGSRLLQGIHAIYDAAGNLVRVTDDAHEVPHSPIAGMTVPARRDYTYDAHRRLTTATGRVHQALLGSPSGFSGTQHLSLANGAAVERFTQSFTYDPSGNLATLVHVGKTHGWTTRMWISKTSNRSLPELDANGVVIDSLVQEAKFDRAGNLLVLPHTRRLDWTHRGVLGRAVLIERSTGIDDAERYVQGGDGLRVRKVTTRLVQGIVEKTDKLYLGDAERTRVYRGDELVLERWIVHVEDAGQRIATIDRWTMDKHRREVDDVDAGARVRYLLNTHQRSSAIEIDQTGKLLSYEEYFPHGGTAFIAGDDVRDVNRKEYRYCGKELDGTGLYDYGYRCYAPWLGRWLSPDPIGPEDDLNLYQFVLGNPVTHVDDDGLQTKKQNCGTVTLPSIERPGSVISSEDTCAGVEEPAPKPKAPSPPPPSPAPSISPQPSASDPGVRTPANTPIPKALAESGSTGPSPAAPSPKSEEPTSTPDSEGDWKKSQGLFEDGRVVPNLFKQVNDDLWKTWDSEPTTNKVVGFLPIMASSAVVSLFQGINDIPNIPTMLAKSLTDWEYGRFGKSLSGLADVASAIPFAGPALSLGKRALSGAVQVAKKALGSIAQAARRIPVFLPVGIGGGGVVRIPRYPRPPAQGGVASNPQDHLFGSTHPTKIFQGGTGKAIAVHGEWLFNEGHFRMPKKQGITIWTGLDKVLPHEAGILIEQGKYSQAVLKFPNHAMMGMNYGPGELVPMLIARPPINFPMIAEGSITVTRRMLLPDILKQLPAGHYNWASCTTKGYWLF